MEESAKAIARPAASRSLREAIRKARLEEAERLHVSADSRDGGSGAPELEAVPANYREAVKRYFTTGETPAP